MPVTRTGLRVVEKEVVVVRLSIKKNKFDEMGCLRKAFKLLVA